MPFLIRIRYVIITPQIIYIIFFPFGDIRISIILVPRQSSHAVWVVFGANEMIAIFYNWFIYFLTHSVFSPSKD